MSKISCKVKECSYNHNCFCEADDVEVVNCGTLHASTSRETACKTFMPYRSCSAENVVGEVNFD